MDYEKKYKDALERAATELETCGADKNLRNMIYAIFPDELKEFESERMVKSITRLVKAYYDCNFPTPEGFERKDMIAWLEKQGQVKESSISQHEIETCKENNDSLTSEDERVRKELLKFLENVFYFGKDANFVKRKKSDCSKWINWLEKQVTSYTKRDVDDAYLKGVTDTKNEIEKQYEANYQIRKDIATFIFNYRGDIKDRAKWMDYLGIKVYFVEKQGEQKFANSAKTCKNEQNFVL